MVVLLLTVVALAGLPTVVGPAHAELVVDVVDQTPDRSTTFHADKMDRGTLFWVEFTTTQPKERRLARGIVSAKMPTTTSDTHLVLWTQTTCVGNDGTYPVSMTNVENIKRGATLHLRPTFIYTAPTPGTYHCMVYIKSNRPRPVDSRPESNVYNIQPNSRLEVTEPLPAAARQRFEPNSKSYLVDAKVHRSRDANNFDWVAPPGLKKFSVHGGLYLTACTSASGSSDPAQGSKYLCTREHRSRSGGIVKTRLTVLQKKRNAAGYCRSAYAPSAAGRETFISRNIHHKIVTYDMTVPISTSPACSRTFRIKLLVSWVRGSSIMIHQQGTLTSAFPEL